MQMVRLSPAQTVMEFPKPWSQGQPLIFKVIFSFLSKLIRHLDIFLLFFKHCMHSCVCAHVCLCSCMCGWRPLLGIYELLSNLFFETESLMEFGVHRFE